MSRTITASNTMPWGLSRRIEERFLPMVAELEAFAQEHPKAYRDKVIRRALLGYLYIVGVVFGLLLCIGLLVLATMAFRGFAAFAVKFFWVIGIAIFMIGRALWVKLDRPEGKAIHRADSPRLFAAIDEIAAKTKGPKLKAVLITHDFNAAVVQHERFGIFGGIENYLLLGLPMLSALSEAEMKAVIAHEFGHLSGAHGRTSGFVYRIRMTWARLSEHFREGMTAFLFQKFFSWYGPWFNAYSFVMARLDEYEADRASALVTSAPIAAQALTRVSLEAERYEQFWRSYFDKIAGIRSPETLPMQALSTYFMAPVEEGFKSRALKDALAEKTDVHDTHPSLSDRLRSLGEAMPELTPIAQSAGLSLLGAHTLQTIHQDFDDEWWKANGISWQNHCDDILNDKERLKLLIARYDEKPEFATFDESEHWDYQTLCERYAENDRALAHIKLYIAHKPDEPYADLAMARVLLAHKDAEGIQWTHRIINGAFANNVKIQALDEALTYLKTHDPDHPERGYFAEAIDKAFALQETIDQEKNTINLSLQLEEHALPAETVAQLTAYCAGFKALSKVWLGLRRLKSDPLQFQYIVSYELKPIGQTDEQKEKVSDALLEFLRHHGNVFCLPVSHDTAWIKTSMKELKTGLVYKA